MVLNVFLQPSRQLLWLVGLLYVITGIIWLYLPFPYAIRGCLVILHSIHFYTVFYHSLSLQAEEAIVGLQYTRATGWTLRTREGNTYKASLQHESLCTRHFVALHFKLEPSKHKRYVMVLPDSLSSTEFRKLRQLLWWGL